MDSETIQHRKEILSQYREIVMMIDNLNHRIKSLDDRAIKIKSPNYNGMPRSSTPYTMIDILADKEDLERRKAKFEKLALEKREGVEDYIDTVHSIKHNSFLYLYYIKGLTIEEISREEGYSLRHSWRLFREAIELVDIA